MALITPSPSFTPKPERRQHHVHSLSQPLISISDAFTGKSQYQLQPSKGTQHRDPLAKETTTDNDQQRMMSSQRDPRSLYHQICATNGILSINGEQHPPQQMAVEDCSEGASEEGKKQSPTPLLYKMQLLHCIEVATKRLLFHLVKTSAVVPNLFMALPFLLLLLSLLLFFFSPHPSVSFLFPSDSLLFGGSDPTNGGACIFAQLAHADGHNQFPEDNPAFDAPQRTLPAEFAIILSTKSRLDSVLPPANRTTLAFIDLFERIQQISVVHQKQNYKWYDVCRQCRLDPIVAHLLMNDLDWNFPEAIAKGGQGMDSALMSTRPSPENRTKEQKPRVFLAGTIGDVVLDSTDGHTLRRAHCLLIRIKLKAQLKVSMLMTFERKLRRVVSNWTHNDVSADHVDLQFWSAQQWSDEVERALRSVHLKMLASGVLLTVILVLGNTKQNAYESRPLLGFQIAFVLLLSILSFYLVHIAGTGVLNPLLFPVPYFLASIGVLIFSVINTSLDRYSGISMHPTEKLAFIFIWDGPCLLLTLGSLTCLCVLSALSADNSLLTHSLIALALGFVSLLLFSLFLTICWLNYAQRVASGLKWFQLCRKGDRTYNEKQLFDYDARTCAHLHEKLSDLRLCFSRRLGSLTCNHNFRMIGFALFTVSCFAAIVGNRPRVQLDMDQFVLHGEGSWAFLDRFQKAFPKYENYLELNFEGPLDYEERKEQIFSLLRWALETGLASKSVSWLAEFDKFRKGVEYRVDEDAILPLLTHAFLPYEPFRKFAADLRISQGQIHRSRMYLELSEEGRRNSEYLMQHLISMARQMGLPLVLKAPFSFSPGHDLQVLWRLCSVLLSLSLLSALLNILQPATALCLLLSNLFLCTFVSSLARYLDIPLNIVTLSTLFYGVLFNSASLLHFAYHFFNAGVRQVKSKQRVAYAFQCTLWPIVLASLCGPICFSVQILIGQHPPIVFSVWKMICACSAVTLVQTIAVLPGLLILLSDYFHCVFAYANQLCDDNANAEMTIDPMAENVYFVPSYPRSTHNNSVLGIGYGRFFYPIAPSAYHSHPLPPSYGPPPIEFPRKSPAQQSIQHQRQHSQLSQQQHTNSPALGSSTGQQQHQPAPPLYSPPNIRRGANDSGGSGKGSSMNEESLESRSDHRLDKRVHRIRSYPSVPSSVQQPTQKRQPPTSREFCNQINIRKREEQIYEDLDSLEENESKISRSWKRSQMGKYSPNGRRKF